MMPVTNKILLVSVLVFVYACSSDKGKNNQYKLIKENSISNYSDNREVFPSVKSYSLKLNNIGYIEFQNNENISIRYQKNRQQNIWSEIKDTKYASSAVKNILELDSIDLSSLDYLKRLLNSIDCNSINIYKGYDSKKGKSNKQIELKYKKWDGLNFFYKIFELPFDSADINFYDKFLQQKNGGGVLGDDVIWYYKK